MYTKTPRSILSLIMLLVLPMGLFVTACKTKAEPTPTALPVPTAKPAPESRLTWDALHNADYPSDFPRGKIARLSNGVYEEEYVPGAATKLVIRMADFGAFGLLDQDEAIDAAVILISDPGGTGTFIHLVAVLDRDGKPHPLKPAPLGDRIAVRAVRIEDHKITLRMRVRGPADPFVKLTREVTRVYSLAGEELVLESESTEDVPSKPPEEFVHDPQSIEVTPGAGPKTIEGTLKPGGIADYIVRAEAGQELRLSVGSLFSNAILSVFGLSDSARLVSRTEYATSWSGTVPTSQEYAIKVISLAGHDLEYSLTVQVLPRPAPTATPAPAATRPLAATPTPVPPSVSLGDIPLLWRGDLRLSERPLSDLSPDANRFLESRDAVWGVAVIVPGQNVVYLANADQQLEMASVVKVLIMLTVLDRAAQEHRYVSEDELELLWPMITESDNDSATYLWNQVGGGAGVKGYLARIGVSGTSPYDGPYWGTSVASARAVSLVFARVAFSDLFDDSSRKLALELLVKVIPSQRWGIPPQAGSQQNHKDTVGLQNGWFPDEQGWRVNSAGFAVSSAGSQPAYAIAVMTNLQPDWPYGIATIEGVASRIHAALHR